MIAYSFCKSFNIYKYYVAIICNKYYFSVFSSKIMPVERGLRATSPVHVHVEDDIPVHVHVKQKGKKVTKKVDVIYAHLHQ